MKIDDQGRVPRLEDAVKKLIQALAAGTSRTPRGMDMHMQLLLILESLKDE